MDEDWTNNRPNWWPEYSPEITKYNGSPISINLEEPLVVESPEIENNMMVEEESHVITDQSDLKTATGNNYSINFRNKRSYDVTSGYAGDLSQAKEECYFCHKQELQIGKAT